MFFKKEGGKHMAKKNKKIIENEKLITLEQQQTIDSFIEETAVFFKSNPAGDTQTLDMKRLLETTKKNMRAAGYSPHMGEQVMEDFFPALVKTSADLQEYLLDPGKNETQIRQVSRTISASITAYKRAVSFLSDIKSFKYFLKCDTPLTKEDIESDEYKKSKIEVFKILKSFNIPYQSRLIDKQTVFEGISFWIFHEEQKTFRFLRIPTEYCYITGPSTFFGYTWAIDLSFFDRMAYLPDSLPELNYAYLKFCKLRTMSLSPENRSDKAAIEATMHSSQYYQVPLSEGCCLVFSETDVIRTPPMAGTMVSALDMSAYRALLKQKAMADLYTMVVHKIPRDDKTGKLLVTFEDASKIIAVIQSVSPYNIKHVASIFDGADPVKMTTSDILQTIGNVGDDQFYSSTGLPSGLFNDKSKTEAALGYAVQGVFGFASSSMYTYITNIFNFLIEKKNKTKYDWSIQFYGNLLMDSVEKTEAIKLANLINNPYLLLSAHGIEPFNVENVLLDDLGYIKEKMIPFASASTQSKEENGRPNEREDNPMKVTTEKGGD